MSDVFPDYKIGFEHIETRQHKCEGVSEWKIYTLDISASEEDVDILTPAPDTSIDSESDSEVETESATDDPMIAEESESTTVFPDESDDSAVTDSPEELAPVNGSEDPVPDAPSPLDIVELLQLFNATKNEVKRQQEANATATASSTATATSTASSSSSTSTADSAASSSSTTKDDEDRGASADELAASFGGVVDEDPATTPAPSGLYFLLDWNSFLEVGDPESARRVNIRIAPKVGDPRRFLPVTVP
ncbi:Uncharacterized protein GBIM_14398 [Gryllus bimaculatus]|nr:Uncharacterized protein GBIM_14398 [Gryllus bimaculatus]